MNGIKSSISLASVDIPSPNGIYSEKTEVKVVWVSNEHVYIVEEHVAFHLAILFVCEIKSDHIEFVFLLVQPLQLPDDLLIVT